MDARLRLSLTYLCKRSQHFYCLRSDKPVTYHDIRHNRLSRSDLHSSALKWQQFCRSRSYSSRPRARCDDLKRDERPCVAMSQDTIPCHAMYIINSEVMYE